MATPKSHRLLKNHDPVIDPEDYDASIARVSNFFNVNYDAKDRIGWVKAHFPKIKFKNSSDLDYRVLSTLVRLINNGNEISDKHQILMDNEVVRLTETKPQVVVQPVAVEQSNSIQEKMDEKVSAFLAEFAALVDDYVLTRTVPKIDSLVNGMGIRGPMVNKVLSRIQGQMSELQEALEGKDKQLVEGYSNFKKIELKRLLGIYESLVTTLGQAKVMTVRKPRKTKAKPPMVVAKNVKFCAEEKELGLKSVYPALAVGASEVWTFNIKTRKLACFKAIDGMELTFKGSTLLNWDTEKSSIKTIRKPQELSKLIGQGTRAYNKFFKEISTKPGTLTGRFGEDTLIMAALK